MAIALDTIGALIDRHHGLGVHCLNPSCRRYVQLDLPALAERLGRDHGVLHRDLAPKLRCSACGGRDVQLTLLTPEPVHGRSV